MSDYEEILEISEDGRFRVKLVRDECPDEPYDEGQSPLLRIERTSYGIRAKHIMAAGRPLDADSYVENAVARWGSPSNPDWALVETYLRAYFGVTKIETWYSGSYWYVTYDPAVWREHVGAPEGSVDMSEWQAYCEGDVWGWVVERRVTWTAVDDDRDDMATWKHMDSCWGYYGSDGANGRYLKSCAREALLDAQVADHGGVFGPLPEPAGYGTALYQGTSHDHEPAVASPDSGSGIEANHPEGYRYCLACLAPLPESS